MNGLNSEKISVIVPVFNVGLYLKKCLESLQQQTYKNIEFILVDDGSTDESASICDGFSKSDNRFSVYHKSNGGASSARNYGLEHISGEYVGFVDADDWVEPDMFEKMYDVIQSEKSDIVICGYFDNNIPYKSNDHREYINIQPVGAIRQCITDDNGILMGASVWNKLFNAKLVRNIRFDEHLYIGEDMEYLCKCIVVANKVSYVNRCLYHYIYRKNSAMNDVFGEKKLTILTANQQVFKIIAGKYPELTGEMQFRESICCFSYLTHALKYGYTNRDTITELLSGMKKKKGMLLHKYHGVRKCLLLWCLMGTPYCVLLGKIMMFRNKIAGLWEAERKIH